MEGNRRGGWNVPCSHMLTAWENWFVHGVLAQQHGNAWHTCRVHTSHRHAQNQWHIVRCVRKTDSQSKALQSGL
jgi:hypothetical protein